MVQQIQIQKGEGNRISVLKETRKNIFSIVNPHFGWKTYYSISFIKRHLDYQKKFNFSGEHLELLVSSFRKWLGTPTYLTFMGKKKDGAPFLKYALASKRGNKVYEYFLHRKLDSHLSFMKDSNFHKVILRDKKGFRGKVSNLLFITLTCDPKKYGNNRVQAWINFEHDYNIFITRFRKKYGRCWIMKSVESTLKGYPHIHLLVIPEKEVDVFSYKSPKSGFIEYRMKDKKILESYWPSLIDVVVPNPKKMQDSGCVDFMKDYIFKDMLKAYSYKSDRSYKNSLSLALGWLFGKRCYSVSRVGVHDLITDTSITQTQIKEILQNDKEKTLVFIGLTDFKSVGKYKDPPPSFEIKNTHKDYQKLLNSVYAKPSTRNVQKVYKPKDLNTLTSY